MNRQLGTASAFYSDTWSWTILRGFQKVFDERARSTIAVVAPGTSDRGAAVCAALALPAPRGGGRGTSRDPRLAARHQAGGGRDRGRDRTRRDRAPGGGGRGGGGGEGKRGGNITARER